MCGAGGACEVLTAGGGVELADAIGVILCSDPDGSRREIVKGRKTSLEILQ